ncbi:MAG: hypothetical protein HFE45_03880 [Oscillospiraceae bacterium]|jgi:hypothetical protein|nr:hypothetical protein [Oscillospiraceae bacterium]
MFKKVCAFAFALIMTLPTQMPVFAVETPENPNETILQQALEIDAEIDVQQSEDFQVVSINSEGAISRASNKSFEEKAIQMVETNGEMAEVTTIVPYKMLPNGEMVNSFAYQSLQVQGTGKTPVPVKFVDVTVTTIAYYAYYQHINGAPFYYRHAGLETYWSSSNSTASISILDVSFESKGELHKYPDCTTDLSLNEADSMVQEEYFIRSSVYQTNPVKDKVYIDGQHAMPTNRALRCVYYDEHGGLVSMELSYSVNGKNYNDRYSYYAYEKTS